MKLFFARLQSTRVPLSKTDVPERRSVPQSQIASGFTLLELLIAAGITFIVIGASLASLVEVMKINQQSESETLRRQDLNRALDFMTDEIRRGTSVALSATTGIQAAVPNFTLPIGATPVLAITIPGVSKPVIYYLQNSVNPWLTPSLIRRWGPTYDANGDYVNPTQPDQWDPDPADGLGDVLVDAIDNQRPSPNPACPTDWTANPPLVARTGFYSCVSADGRSVSVTLQARVKGASGATPKVYKLSSDISVRSR